MRRVQIAAQPLGELLVGSAEAERRAQVVAARGEEARVEPALGREAGARAAAAERLRDRGDDADLAGAVEVAPAAGVASGRSAATGSSGQRSEMLPTISSALTTSSSRQPFVEPTSMYSMKRRTWPLPRKCSASARTSPSFAPRLTTALTFTGSPAAAAASIPSSTCWTGKSTSFMARNASSSSESRLTVTRLRPAAASASAFCGEERAVRRQRELEPVAVGRLDRGEQLDEVLDVAADERLAAGEAHGADAEAGEDADDAGHLLEREQLAALEERVLAPEDLLRHAVDAAEVAAVGDRDAQGLERAPEPVEQRFHALQYCRRYFGPHARELDERRGGEAHVLDADPLALAVRVVAAGEEVRRGQAHLGQRRAVGAAADRRLLRLEPHAADRFLEVRDDLGVRLERVAHVAVLDSVLDLDRAARLGRGDLLGDAAQDGDMLVEAVVLEVANDEAQLYLRRVALDDDRMDVALAALGRLGRERSWAAGRGSRRRA